MEMIRLAEKRNRCKHRIPRTFRPFLSQERSVPVRGYQDLVVWQKSVELAVAVYELSAFFPATERYGITQQLRRAAVSVSSNIAEGSGRATAPALINFLSHSRGSVKETESLHLVRQRLDFLPFSRAEKAMELTDEVSRMLVTLQRRLKGRL
jgi:four helix bundle protein